MTYSTAPRISKLMEVRDRAWGVVPPSAAGLAPVSDEWCRALVTHHANEFSKSRAARKQEKQEQIERESKQFWNTAV